MKCAIAHYHELALKGHNRDYFEQSLITNIRTALKDLGIRQVQNLHSRIRIELPPEVDLDVIRDRLIRVCGIANFSLGRVIPLQLGDPDLEALSAAAVAELNAKSFHTFRVTAKRADKRLALTSMDIEKSVGAAICERTGKQVSLKHPDLTVYIELLTKDAFCSAEKVEGPGGMPTGVSGKVACLTSGGIDSPVAAYRLIKRGCLATFVHFSGRPLVSRASEEKVRDLVRTLTQYQYHSRLYVIPFGEIQREIVLTAPAPFRVVLYRRMMVRITEELARREQCWALVTGDSLGQVASQTPQNLCAIEEAAELPILRPLIGMDKREIIDEARRLGTYETSIEPDQDCCKLFVPPHPNTKTRVDDVLRIERTLDIAGLVKRGLEKVELTEFSFPHSAT
ncbi:MAG: tRNA 4-thiouridine(8) synthase ThiI [Nitrospira sp.]|nr:tRNA 4-thiouridine(8) synthase ThiI [Nitrospira sp.]MDH4302860.1 tRNA 4-thiouridine(8) synthase ThiI [Nitrospira sp.]MDH5192995.1 tRNA 4-thiouridine(8) synthase ThiI [Nitrospira sp.]